MPLPARLPELPVSAPAPRPTPALYLHGFASSPESTKARYFAERLATHDVALITPDFNEPDFTTLTMSRMLEQLEHEIDSVGGRATLIGPIVGAFFVNGAKSWFTQAFPEFWLYFLGALFIAVTLFLPQGIIGLVRKVKEKA